MFSRDESLARRPRTPDLEAFGHKNTAMREAAVFQTEAEFREWFERNLTRFGFARIILSQEPCPDYVLEKLDGTIVRAEAELFAINFRYHRHDPAKVDLIIACYAKEPELDGIPVIAANELWTEEEEILELLSPEGELSDVEAIILSMAFATGGIDISAMALNSADKRLAGDHDIFFRIPPHYCPAKKRLSTCKLLLMHYLHEVRRGNDLN
jgi:hypothetical protein